MNPKIQIKYVDTPKSNIFSSASLPRSDVEKNATRNKRRNNCGKVEAHVELGLALCGKLSKSAELECIQSPGDTQSTQSTRFESHGTNCWVSNQNDAASSSHVRLSDAKTNDIARKLAAVDTNQVQSFPERARKLVTENFDISTTGTTRRGRTISAYLVLMFHTSRKSTRICDNNSGASQKTKWRTSV